MANILPTKLDLFLLAESVRQEHGGKFTIIGAFAAGQIVIPEDVPLPATLPLAFYAQFYDGSGEFQPMVRMFLPSGAELASFAIPKIPKIPKQALTLVLNFPVFQLPEIGVYKLEFVLDGKVYAEKISLIRGVIPTG